MNEPKRIFLGALDVEPGQALAIDLPADLDPDAVKALLAASADEILARVLPGGKVSGGEYRATGPDGSKWAVVVRGSKTGAWQCYGSAGVAGPTCSGSAVTSLSFRPAPARA